MRSPMIPCGTLALQANHAGFPDKKDNPKWRELHASLEDSPQAAASPQCSPDDLYLHLPRERDAWRILSRACGEESLIADLSQTVTRGASRTDHKLPTITPGSVLAMSKACRVLVLMRKSFSMAFRFTAWSFHLRSARSRWRKWVVTPCMCMWWEQRCFLLWPWWIGRSLPQMVPNCSAIAKGPRSKVHHGPRSQSDRRSPSRRIVTTRE